MIYYSNKMQNKTRTSKHAKTYSIFSLFVFFLFFIWKYYFLNTTLIFIAIFHSTKEITETKIQQHFSVQCSIRFGHVFLYINLIEKFKKRKKGSNNSNQNSNSKRQRNRSIIYFCLLSTSVSVCAPERQNSIRKRKQKQNNCERVMSDSKQESKTDDVVWNYFLEFMSLFMVIAVNISLSLSLNAQCTFCSSTYRDNGSFVPMLLRFLQIVYCFFFSLSFFSQVKFTFVL